MPPYVSCGELPAGQGGGPGRPGRSSACLPCPPAAQRCQHSTDSLAAVAREAAAGEAGGLRGMARQEPHLAALSSRGLGSVLTALFARCKLLDRGAGPPIGRGGRVMGGGLHGSLCGELAPCRPPTVGMTPITAWGARWRRASRRQAAGGAAAHPVQPRPGLQLQTVAFCALGA